jgi:hypothetical protein
MTQTFNHLIKYCWLFCLIFLSHFTVLHGQVVVQGEVIDEGTGKPLAFVNIQESRQTNGTYSTIDGQFQLSVNSLATTLRFSIIGYETKMVEITAANRIGLFVRLKEKQVELNEVIVFPGVNPADEWMRKLIARKDTLNPNKLDAYKYKAYHKFIFTSNQDTLPGQLGSSILGLKDSTEIILRELLKKQHLFLNESVSEKKFKFPDKNYEKVIASKTSGMKLPVFSTLTTQLQSISFYDASFSVLGKNYLNPISAGGLKSYQFQIMDTTFSKNDTVLIISFNPKKKNDESLLKGVINLNIKEVALETVIAEPYDKNDVHVSIRHQYVKTDGGRWFPIEINTDLQLTNLSLNRTQLVAEGRTYIKEIEINPNLTSADFGEIELEVDEKAIKKQDSTFVRYRENDLTSKDSLTYKTLDSISKVFNIDRRIMAVEALFTGKLRIKFIDIDINRLVTFNNYEGIRIGAGISTNTALVKWWIFGGYVGYGFKDKAIKYGGFTEFILHKKNDVRFRFDYQQDLRESGLTDYPLESPVSIDNLSRSFVLNTFDSIQQFEFSFRGKPVQNLQLQLSANYQLINPTYAYRHIADTNNRNPIFRYAEIQFTARWGVKEKYIQFGSLYLSTGNKYPVFWFHIAQSIPLLNTSFIYTRMMGKVEQSFDFKKGGKIKTIISGGIVLNDVPYHKLFNERGSFADLSNVARGSFETMRANEFISDRFVSWILHYNIGRLFKIGKFIKPELTLVHNAGFGWLNQPERHLDVPFKTMEKGFFEGGFIIDNILYFNANGLGVGVFYRYGEYADPTWYKNFYVKLAFAFGLR